MSEVKSSVTSMRRQPQQARSLERVKRILDAAEALFSTQGYAATTTSAIATQADVSIGSLYQFFPDKSAILQALALRYTDLLHHDLMGIDTSNADLPLAEYVNQLIDQANYFFTEHPSYHAIFMEVQGTMRELDDIDEAADTQLIDALAQSLARYSSEARTIKPEDYQAMAFVLVKTVGTLLWLSLSQVPPDRQRLVHETKRLTLAYLDSYFR